ncbi:MAG: hypothetical protein K0S07_219 [Chlamydiales bacterium]|jgi:hypothetical protein|nr:hypothetical protein [Chlamydiales bacterium]
MLSINFADNSIFKMVPLLTPAIHKRSTGEWKTDYTLLDRRDKIVAWAAIATAVATVALAIFTASPLIIPVGVLIIPTIAYTIWSADLHCAERAIEPKNVEDFCRLEHPSSSLISHIASQLNLIQRVVALKGDLNKTSDAKDSLLQAAIRQESGEAPPSFEKIRYMLAHGASPLKNQILLKAIVEKKTALILLFLDSLQEEEIALFKEEPRELAMIAKWLVMDSHMSSPIPNEVISSLCAKLHTSWEELQAVAENAGDDVLTLFQDYLT